MKQNKKKKKEEKQLKRKGRELKKKPKLRGRLMQKQLMKIESTDF